jgi:hypothetical protein
MGNSISGVPCQRAAPGPLPRFAVTLALIAAVLVAAGAWAMALAPAARAGETARDASPGRATSVVIDSVTPQLARPGGTVTVTGTVTNQSGGPLSGLSIQLRSSASRLTYRGELTSYAAGSLALDAPVGTPVQLSGSLPSGATAAWRVSLPVNAIGMTQFGVYPLAAQAVDVIGVPVGTDRTFLPFWPGAAAAGVSQPLKIGWVWPLINTPQQAMCSALTSNSLASSVAPGGRLNTLLASGAAYSARAHLTWAVDPGLLTSVSTMTGPYRVGGASDCVGGTRYHASGAAAQWLSTVRTATSGQQMFVTPYDDVDVAALTHQGLDSDLTTAFDQGRSAGSALLGRSFGPSASTGSAGRSAVRASSSDAIAWPADGMADSSVLGNLAVNGVSTVVLNSGEMPPTSSGYTADDAVTSIPTAAGTNMRVLLADTTLTGILGSATSAPGGSFAVSQRFLAETAMIVAEDPGLARSIVVAPPRQWNPPAALASQLLNETVTAPWLSPTTLAGLAGSASSAGQTTRQAPPDAYVSGQELSSAYLKQVAAADAGLRLYKSILSRPQPQYLNGLNAGIAATESSAWRGGPAARQRGENILGRVSGYISAASRKVQIINSARVTLGGSSGKVPVSIANALPEAIQVRLQATGPSDGRLTVTGNHGLITIAAGSTQTVPLSVRSDAVGDTSIQLRLLGANGVPLPGDPVSLGVQSTQFGTTLFVIIFAALGVLVLTAIARAIRRGLRDDGPVPHPSDQPQNEPERPLGMPSPVGGAANVETGNDTTDPRDPPEAPDDFAEARGWASYS